MYEHHREQLLPARLFIRRVAGHFSLAAGATVFALTIGIVGYHWLDGLRWVDAFVNASMILGGMGPVDTLKNDPSKIFAGLYALFSGIVFIGVASVIIAPFIHRLMHKLHMPDK